ncbi:MAG TPA: energy transducer TonB, partial [Accumulibacter sp.]|nr:energy transducer TonB [Accumulibacter sp.]
TTTVPVAAPPVTLAARLPAVPALPQLSNDEPLLKNTLAEETSKPVTKPRRPPVTKPSSSKAAPRAVAAAQRKLSNHLYYPPEAVARGLEGEVRLLLELDDDGTIREVGVVASSGHRLLDQAAVNAALRMGRIASSQARQMILPVSFRLE